MRYERIVMIAAVIAVILVNVVESVTVEAGESIAIVSAKDGSYMEKLAAREVRRYIYVRTGALLPIVQLADAERYADGWIIVARKDRSIVRMIGRDIDVVRDSLVKLDADGYLLKTFRWSDRPVSLVAGGDAGTLYGAYRFAEHLGIRFYLHGDVVPDRKVALKLPHLDEVAKPLFEMRGIQPFHDFPEGPDWWELDDYKAIISQLPKLRMNFFALHTYPEGHVGPEPAVWIGVPDDIGGAGRVEFSYPARWFTTLNGCWGYQPKKTSDYSFGTSSLFDRDAYGSDVMRGMAPWPKTPDACNEIFYRSGVLLHGAFSHAHKLGVKTCIGTETPLTVPKTVRARGPAEVQKLYEGMFLRIAGTYPVDYYWLWTPEGWTWGGAKDKQIDDTVKDLQTAVAAAKKVKAPFTLATCGWVLGPPKDRALFDNILPKDMPMSCISRKVGQAPVEPGFAGVKGRPKWSIPWLEDDPALNSPQLWVGRMRKDAADSLKYGCTGLMGIHWRTRILGPNVSALAAAAWDQSKWNKPIPEPRRRPGPVGGNIAGFPNNPIANTDDDPLYQTVRYDVSAYHFSLPNGKYKVTLKFCEPHYKETGKRVFGVKLQGKLVIDKLDVFARVGRNAPLDYTFEDVEVGQKWLHVDFVYQVEYPCIAAIVAEGAGGGVKINCGGPKYKDYAADRAETVGGAKPGRFLPTGDFYRDWARSQFGAEVAEQAAELFRRIDGKLPRPSQWAGGPGGIRPDGRPWEKVAAEFGFVHEMAKLRPLVKGTGYIERFDYWLNSFSRMKATARVKCTWAQYNAVIKKVKAQKDAEARRRMARETALPLRKQLIEDVTDVYRFLLPTITNTGEMGNLANWEQHIQPGLLTAPGNELAKILGEPLPGDAKLPRLYSGPLRIIMPPKRTSLEFGESLVLKVLILAGKAPQEARLFWRPMGKGKFAGKPLTHVARGVYTARIPAPKEDVEYYVEAAPEGGKPVRFPATAPELCHTVIVLPLSQ